MKKILFPLLLLLAMFVYFIPVRAQTDMDKMMKIPPEMRAGRMTDMMKSSLNLSADQAVKVNAINLKYAKQNQDIYNSTQPKMEKMKIFKSNETSKDAELKSVLSADQYKNYLMKKDGMKNQMMNK